MKLSLILLTLLISCSLVGQKTITQEDFPDGYYAIPINTPFDLMIDLSITGAHSIWDYSELSNSSQSTEYAYDIASGGMVMGLQFGQFAPQRYKATYYQPYAGLPLDQFSDFLPISIESINKVTKVAEEKVTTVGYSLEIQGTQVGFRSDTIEVTHLLPLNYLDTFSSTGYTNIDFSPFLDAQFRQHRTRTSEVDGYGKLITPYGTYTDVLRIHHKIKEKDSLHVVTEIMGFPIDQWIPISRTLHTYEWWDNDRKRPILSVETEGVFGNDVPTQISFIDEEALSVSENEIQAKIYPNPATNIITIESNEPIGECILYSVDGKEVLRHSTYGYSFQMDISHLTPAIYNLQIVGNKGIKNKRIVIR